MTSLSDLLKTLEDIDQELIDVPLPDHKDILEQTQDKVDSYRDFIIRLEDRAERLKKDAKDALLKSVSLENKAEHIKSYLKFCSKVFGIQKFKGNRFAFSVSTRKMLKTECDAIPGHPCAKEKTFYSWDREALQEVYKQDPEALKGVAHEEDIQSIRFTLLGS